MDILNTPPTEQEVREHFNLSADAPLMKVPQTTIWALEDGTLLWDWRNGYAPIQKPYVSHGRTPNYTETTNVALVEPRRAKSSEKHSVSPQGIIAGQREQILQLREEVAQLKKELAKYRIDLSLYKST